MNTTKETWMPVVDYECEYIVSSKGDVKRIKGGRGSVIGRVLKPYLNKSNGYYIITLSKNCIQTDYPLHRVVAEAFLGRSKLHVNHKNGIKTDNRIENLEFVTVRENLNHACSSLGVRCCDKHWNSRLTSREVQKIRSLATSTLTHQQIANAFKISRTTVSQILSYKRWKNLPMPFVSST